MQRTGQSRVGFDETRLIAGAAATAGKRSLRNRVGAVAALVMCASSCLAAGTQLVQMIPIPGVPLVSYDISFVDSTRHQYYLADRSNKGVDIFDTRTNEFVGRIGGFVGFTGNNDTSGPDGVVA